MIYPAQQDFPILLMLTEASSYPQAFTFGEGRGVIATNTGKGALAIEMDNGISFSVPEGASFSDYFPKFRSISAAGSTAFQIGVR